MSIKKRHGKTAKLEGRQFGYLTVIEYSHTNYRAYWKCKCKCGNEVLVTSNRLTTGNTKSCGCYHREQTSAANHKHGKCGTKLHFIWRSMVNRTLNLKSREKRGKYYKDITLCEDWKTYTVFEKWALGHGYKEGLQLDRIDSAKDYCPDNCQWLTITEHSSKTSKERWKRHRERLRV